MQTKPETAIGLDVGGTRIRAARIERCGHMRARLAEPVARDRAAFVAQVVRLIEAVRDGSTCAVGIGLPGRIAGVTGGVHSAGYLDIAGLDLAGVVTEQTGLPCRIGNDAAMALVAEAQGMAGLVAMITIGTGVGGALLLDGRPFYGSNFAGQFGHMVVDHEGPLCKCGQRGCIETFCAGPALGALITKGGLPETTKAEDLLDATDAGDEAAAELVKAWASPMTRALQSLIAVVDPACIILGGGLGHDMARALGHLPKAGTWFDRPVVAARMGDDAGTIGAGLAGFLAVGPT
ncbi:ROK family protein [Donghicola tyrosinivorans]|uniref:Putative NBD/HSP70 family sugar kinase n=1 Tax=Donghicola tyrosinivorans TaxID=1652492 RepID=A0A2T0WEE2_9RHOB|nr:ROK family protein [Donghicola tyrosinivorans]PRY85062.1 putative NBD/HSP70 family sugar kinase [Donghicola tyrosinivorans]